MYFYLFRIAGLQVHEFDIILSDLHCRVKGGAGANADITG